MNRLIMICSAFLFALFCKAQIENKSLQFTGIEDVRFNQIAELDTCKQVTLQMWVNIESWTENSKLFCQNTNNNNNLFSIQLGKKNTSELQLYINNTIYTYTDLKLTEGKWFQITLLKSNADETKCRLFVNGIESVNYNKKPREIAYNNADTNFVLGSGFTGKIDEVRIWKKALNNADFYLHNTVNKYHPDYSGLVAYWKADQLINSFLLDELQHHHSITKKPSLIKVTDNKLFNYKLVSGYTTFSSLFTREVSKEAYLLTNDLLILSGNTGPDGKVTFGPSDESGITVNTDYLTQFEGRNGVIKFNGKNASFKVPDQSFSATDEFCFEGWMFIDKWENGAYLLRKNQSNKDLFSIRLSKKNRISVHFENETIIPSIKLKIKEWQFLSVSAKWDEKTQRTAITVNVIDKNYKITSAQSVTKAQLAKCLTDTAQCSIGVNFSGRMDDISFWKTERKMDFAVDVKGLAIIEIGKTTPVENSTNCSAYWKYDAPDLPGLDSYSWTNYVRIIRSAFEGYTGYKVRASFSGGSEKNWEEMITNEQSRQRFAKGIAALLKSPLLDGVDLDFEWCYDDTCWANYAKTIHEVRKVIPAGKIFTVTPHVVAYKLPVQAISDIDFALFQNYGPSPDRFTFDDYTRSLETFRKQGYPDQKIILSTSTTTSKGISANGDSKRPTAYKNLINSGSVVSKDALSGTLDGYTYWINSVEQTRQRANYVVANNLAGIMFWDMGCDVSPDSEFSIVRAINSEISSNLGLKKYE